MKIASLSFAHLMPSANSSSSDSWCAQPLLWIRTIGCQLKSSAPHQIPPGPRPQHCNILLCFVLTSLSRTPFCSVWDEQCSFALLQAQKSMDIFAVQYPYSLHIYIRWSFEALVGKSLTQFCSIILKMKYRKYGIFIFWSKLSNMKEVLCNNKCMCDVHVRVLLRFFIKRTFGLLIGRRSWEPFTTFYCFFASLCYLYTRVQLQFLQDSSQASHTKIVQIKRKSTGSLKTMVCTQDRVGTVGSRWNEARLPSFRDQMQLWQRRAGYLFAGFGSTFVWV